MNIGMVIITGFMARVVFIAIARYLELLLNTELHAVSTFLVAYRYGTP